MHDTELKLKLAEYLPEELHVYTNHSFGGKTLFWGKLTDKEPWAVKDTELLEICHRIEEKMTPVQQIQYIEKLSMDLNMIVYGYYPDEASIDLGACFQVAHATWQQRANAIIQTLGTK